MHASVGIVSLDTCPQFGQVSCDVVIIAMIAIERASPWTAQQLLWERGQQKGKYRAQGQTREGKGA
jgi:hypothetical protein